MKMPNNTIESAKKYFKDELNRHYDASEIEQMMQITFQHFFKLTKIDLLLNLTKQLSESELLKVIYTVKELKQNKPLAYILGEWEFYGLSFKVNEYTLIPRPETEELVDLIIKENQGKLSVLDIGTGTGCIPIALKKNNKNFIATALDVSDEALVVAKENAISNEVEISFVKSDILESSNKEFGQKLDIIISNPPYIANGEKSIMSDNVLDFEPHLALFVEDDEALIFYDTISDFALINLNDGGKLYFEINEKYGNEVKLLLEKKGFKNVNIVKDINTKDRIVSCNL